MHKSELVEKVHEALQSSGFSKADVGRVINATFDVISETLSSGERVALKGFGTFNVKERKAREGINPQTGKKIKIGSRKAVTFTVSSSLKESVKSGS